MFQVNLQFHFGLIWSKIDSIENGYLLCDALQLMEIDKAENGHVGRMDFHVAQKHIFIDDRVQSANVNQSIVITICKLLLTKWDEITFEFSFITSRIFF